MSELVQTYKTIRKAFVAYTVHMLRQKGPDALPQRMDGVLVVRKVHIFIKWKTSSDNSCRGQRNRCSNGE